MGVIYIIIINMYSAHVSLCFCYSLANLCSHSDSIIPLGDHDYKNINLDFDKDGQLNNLQEPVSQLMGYQVRKFSSKCYCAWQ